MAKKLFAVIAITSTAFVALFGFMAVSHAMSDMDDHASCIAALAENAFCGSLSGAWAALDFHMNFLRGLMTAVFAAMVGALLFILVARIMDEFVNKPLFSASSLVLALSFSATGYGRESLKYLSLHINSPSVY